LNLVEEYIPTKNTKIEVSSATGSVLNLVEEYVPNKNMDITIASATGSVLNLVQEYVPNKNIHFAISSATGSVLNLVEEYVPTKNIHIKVASATSSNPALLIQFFDTKDGVFDFIGNETLADRLNRSYSDLIDSWGTSSNDTHFLHLATGSEGKYGDYNTYHYEKRYIFNMIGDVERVSGSYPSVSSSFITDFTGTVTAGVYTASKDFHNKTLVSSEIGLGTRPLGITVEFKPTGSISFRGGKFFDETFVYPANHQFVVGTSRDSIDGLIYTGTQNQGGDTIESEAFLDLSTDAFYYILTTGGSGYTIQYDA